LIASEQSPHAEAPPLPPVPTRTKSVDVVPVVEPLAFDVAQPEKSDIESATTATSQKIVFIELSAGQLALTSENR
jgi:hypothetical protein